MMKELWICNFLGIYHLAPQRCKYVPERPPAIGRIMREGLSFDGDNSLAQEPFSRIIRTSFEKEVEEVEHLTQKAIQLRSYRP
ncbi:uncharacterized protein ColSpa_05301 [Colletotrichum spaethianum]|uniref:Uncharacterized protein n=1 Tax=Colletotrichum spaethianum TaxID=700344 RepID=A0AA37LEK6_9PEZI|nr:uncharacterized protein ColSpa_05301 [Colletotrichum spaethianum]GKT45120.1 hypothetical protein ColSpa_05301 [Colletotrichum spaethianum]